MNDINMNLLNVGEKYTSPQLASMWGYKSHHALVKGMVMPKEKNIIILFVTLKKKLGATQYKDFISDNVLHMMGQEKHGSDSRLFENLESKKDNIYLFCRDRHSTPFEFYGPCTITNGIRNTDKPSEFEFSIDRFGEKVQVDNAVIEDIINILSEQLDTTQLFSEGTKKIAQHVIYERNPKSRSEAIKVHGHKCKVCGFDFNDFYGQELANNYIEVHHIKQLADGKQLIDPAEDLIPVCSNCHSMLHKRRSGNITIEKLTELTKGTNSLNSI